MSKIFISHSSRDKEFVRKLAGDLIKAGCTPWLDEWELRVGDCIVSGIEKSLDEADFLILVLSPESVASQWVDREWKVKYWSEVERGSVLLLPILLSDCKIPSLIRSKKYADFRTSYSEGFSQLLKAIDPTPVISRTFSQLNGRCVSLARRGFSDGPQRIMMLMCGDNTWSAVGVVEAVGPLEPSIQASGMSVLGLQQYFRELGGEPSLNEIGRFCFTFVDQCFRQIREGDGLRGGELGGKMAMVIQSAESAYFASVGDSAGLGKWTNSEGEQTFLRINGPTLGTLELPTFDPAFAIDNPLGYMHFRADEFSLTKIPFSRDDDFVLLSSRRLAAGSETELEQLCQVLNTFTSGAAVSRYVCDTQMRTGDYAAVVLWNSKCPSS